MTEQNLARDYADNIWTTICTDTDNGYPFGYDSSRLDYGYDDAEVSAYDYLEDVLDITYMIASDRTYRGAQLTLAVGGPNVYLDTTTRELSVYWGGDKVSRYVPQTFVDRLDEALEEIWSMN